MSIASIFCTHCGAKLPAHSKFCNICGNSLDLPELGIDPDSTMDDSTLPHANVLDNNAVYIDDDDDDDFHIEEPATVFTGTQRAGNKTISPVTAYAAESNEFADEDYYFAEDEVDVAAPSTASESVSETKMSPSVQSPEASADLHKHPPKADPVRVEPKSTATKEQSATGSSPADAGLMVTPKAQWRLVYALLNRCEIRPSCEADLLALRALGFDLPDVYIENVMPTRSNTKVSDEDTSNASAAPPPVRPHPPAHSSERATPPQRPMRQPSGRSQYSEQNPHPRNVPPDPNGYRQPQHMQGKQYPAQPQQRSQQRPDPLRQNQPQPRRAPQPPRQNTASYSYPQPEDDYYDDVPTLGERRKKNNGIDKDTLIKCIAVGFAAVLVIAVIFIVLPRL